MLADRSDRNDPINATALHRELCARGFTGGYDIVRRWAARRRNGAPVRPPATRIPSTWRITRWLTGDRAALSAEDRAFTEALRVVRRR